MREFVAGLTPKNMTIFVARELDTPDGVVAFKDAVLVKVKLEGSHATVSMRRVTVPADGNFTVPKPVLVENTEGVFVVDETENLENQFQPPGPKIPGIPVYFGTEYGHTFIEGLQWQLHHPPPFKPIALPIYDYRILQEDEQGQFAAYESFAKLFAEDPLAVPDQDVLFLPSPPVNLETHSLVQEPPRFNCYWPNVPGEDQKMSGKDDETAIFVPYPFPWWNYVPNAMGMPPGVFYPPTFDLWQATGVNTQVKLQVDVRELFGDRGPLTGKEQRELIGVRHIYKSTEGWEPPEVHPDKLHSAMEQIEMATEVPDKMKYFYKGCVPFPPDQFHPDDD